MQFTFGPGECVITPVTDTYGNSIAVPTPRRMGAFQEANFDSSAEIKPMNGSNMYPITVGTGKGKTSLKLKMGQVSVDQFNGIYIGQPLNQTASQTGAVMDTSGSVIPATPFQITQVIPGSGTWSEDLGVVDGSGNVYKAVASGPTTHEYSVAAGVYTFAAADTGNKVFISFGYTATSTTAQTLVVQNSPMGTKPKLIVNLVQTFQGSQFRLKLYSAIATKITLPGKLDDFAYPEIDLEGFADSNNDVFMLAGAQ